ncbi:MAG: CooT family nickel-binding protein [Deltaproteobacteria bacterium]|nr:CooT family nickel-binding protein [Deltaproteobacteria bacterium]
MCEANAYLKKSEEESLMIMENVYNLKPEDGKILLENIFGEQKLVDAEIGQISLMEHKIILQPKTP